MSVTLRAPAVSGVLLAGNDDRYNSVCYFDFTLPDDWDNGSVLADLVLTITGGPQAEAGSAFPAGFDIFFEVFILTVDGGSALDADLCASGNGFAVGSVVRNYFLGSTDHWDTEGLGQSTQLVYSPTQDSTASATLLDHGGGENYYVNEITGTAQGPVGWKPPIQSSGDGTTPEALLEAGQTVTFQFYMYSDAYDLGSDEAYGAIESVNLAYKGTDYPIDVTSFRVGWNAGDSYDAFSGAVTTEIFPNPRRIVEAEEPPIDHPNHQGWVDFYLAGETDPEPDFVDVSVAFEGVGSLAITVRSFECQTDSETTWECTTPEADPWACATPDDTDWTCADDEPGVGYGVLIDVDDDFITYINGGRIKLI